MATKNLPFNSSHQVKLFIRVSNLSSVVEKQVQTLRIVAHDKCQLKSAIVRLKRREIKDNRCRQDSAGYQSCPFKGQLYYLSTMVHQGFSCFCQNLAPYSQSNLSKFLDFYVTYNTKIGQLGRYSKQTCDIKISPSVKDLNGLQRQIFDLHTTKQQTL